MVAIIIAIAILAYACNNPDMFVKPKMRPFNYNVGWHRFPCIFADHYFAKGLKKCKAQLVGAVFVSKVFYPPTNTPAAWLKIFFSQHRE